jgi:hypothetical protein
MHVVVVPILLGRGVNLWTGLDGLEKDFDVEAVSSPAGDAPDVHPRGAVTLR